MQLRRAVSCQQLPLLPRVTHYPPLGVLAFTLRLTPASAARDGLAAFAAL